MADERDTPDLLIQAGHGSREAQSALVDRYVFAPKAARQIEDIVSAELMARLAVAHGQTEDVRRLAAVLMIRGGYERLHGDVSTAAAYDAEALGLFELCANEGDEVAERALVQAASVLPAAPFELLKAAREGVQ